METCQNYIFDKQVYVHVLLGTSVQDIGKVTEGVFQN